MTFGLCQIRLWICEFDSTVKVMIDKVISRLLWSDKPSPNEIKMQYFMWALGRHAYCYHLFIVISFSLSQSDPIKRLAVYYNWSRQKLNYGISVLHTTLVDGTYRFRYRYRPTNKNRLSLYWYRNCWHFGIGRNVGFGRSLLHTHCNLVSDNPDLNPFLRQLLKGFERHC